MYVQDIDQIITTLPFTPLGDSTRDKLLSEGVDPRLLLDSKTLFQDLAKVGTASYTLILDTYAQGAFSSVAYAGSTIVPHRDCAQLFQHLKNLLKKDEKAHFNVYWGNIDSIGHIYGPDSSEYADAIAQFFGEFESFLKSMQPEESLGAHIMVTADHGQITVNPTQIIWLDDFPELTENLALSKSGKKILPWGQYRDVFLKIKPGKLKASYQLLSDKLQDLAIVIKSRDALARGLYGQGELHPKIIDRLGDLLVLPKDNRTVWYKHYEGEVFEHKGVHGGLSAEEMQVPFAFAQLQNLL